MLLFCVHSPLHTTQCSFCVFAKRLGKMNCVSSFFSRCPVQGLLISCNQMSADYLFQQDKLYDVRFDTGDKVIQCGRHNDIFKFWLQWRAKVSSGEIKMPKHSTCCRCATCSFYFVAGGPRIREADQQTDGLDGLPGEMSLISATLSDWKKRNPTSFLPDQEDEGAGGEVLPAERRAGVHQRHLLVRSCCVPTSCNQYHPNLLSQHLFS